MVFPRWLNESRSLYEQLDFRPADKKVVLLGAGGAARAALVALAQAGAAEIVIANRTRSKAEKLVAEFLPHFPGQVIRSVPFEGPELIAELADAALLLNTTAVGLRGESFALPLAEALNKEAVLFDMVYAEALTPLQQSAKQLGLRFADGRGMLAGQGEAAFLLWFAVAPPAGVMQSMVIK